MKFQKTILMMFICIFFVGLGLSYSADTEKGSKQRTRGSVLYQEGAKVAIEKNGKKETITIPVYGVAGIPFPASPLKVDATATLMATKIMISGIENGLLLPELSSAVPMYIGQTNDGKKENKFFTHAINVSWEFTKSGIFFDTDDAKYISEKAGATIQFTDNGIKMDGIKKMQKTKKK